MGNPTETEIEGCKPHHEQRQMAKFMILFRPDSVEREMLPPPLSSGHSQKGQSCHKRDGEEVGVPRASQVRDQ